MDGNTIEANQRLLDQMKARLDETGIIEEAGTWGYIIHTYKGLLSEAGRDGGTIRPDEVRPLFAAWLGVRTREEMSLEEGLASACREQAKLALHKTLDSMGVADDWPADLPATPAAERLADRLEDADDGSKDWKAIRETYRGAMGLTGLANRLGGDLPDLFAGWLRVYASSLPAKTSARAACERAFNLIKEPSC